MAIDHNIDYIFNDNTFSQSNFSGLGISISIQWTKVPGPENERLQSLFKGVYGWE